MTSTATSRSLRGTVVRLLTGLAVIFGLTVAVAGPASAHHPEISGTVDCAGQATFESVSWAVGQKQGRNPDIDVYYSTNNGATWTFLKQGAYTAANNYRFTGSVNIGSATQVKFKAYAAGTWESGAAGGQTTVSANYAKPTNCDQSQVVIKGDCSGYSVKLDNYGSRVPVTFEVTINGTTKTEPVPAGQTKTLTGDVVEGQNTITVKVNGVVKATKTFTVDCEKPAATFSYTCDTWTAVLDNSGSTKAVTFTITVNGDVKTYPVPAGQTQTVTDDVVEGTDYTVTIKAGYDTLVDQSFTVDCKKPAAAVTKVDCTGYSATLDNTASQVATDFVVDVNGVQTPVTVPAGQTQTVTGTVTGATTVTVTSEGTQLSTVSFTGTCEVPPTNPPTNPPVVTPPPVTPPTTEVEGVEASGKAVGSLKVSCQGTVRVALKNRSSERAVYTVKVGSKATKIAVKADSKKTWVTSGKAKQTAKLMLGKKLLAKKTLPNACRKPDVLPDTGLGQVAGSASAALPTLTVPAIGVRATIAPTGLTASGKLAVGSSVTKVYAWKNGVKPGQPGSAVLAGHTYSKGAGVFDKLGKLHRGDRFTAGKATFQVTRVARVKGLSTRQVRDLFSDRGPARAVLVTCGDRTADGIYHSRILVFAKKI